MGLPLVTTNYTEWLERNSHPSAKLTTEVKRKLGMRQHFQCVDSQDVPKHQPQGVRGSRKQIVMKIPIQAKRQLSMKQSTSVDSEALLHAM